MDNGCVFICFLRDTEQDALSNFLGNQGDGDGDNNSDSAGGQTDEAPATGMSESKSGSSSGGGSFGRQSAKPRYLIFVIPKKINMSSC